MGRPKLFKEETVVDSIFLLVEDKKKAIQLAKALGMSKAAFYRKAIVEFIEENKKFLEQPLLKDEPEDDTTTDPSASGE